MSCGQCFECDNCVVYCPQTAVARVPKKEATTGRYVYTDYDKCIGCHICKDVCPTATSRWARRVAPCPAGVPRQVRCAGVGWRLSRSSRARCRPRPMPVRGARLARAAPPLRDRRRKLRRGHRVHRRNHMELIRHQRDLTVHEGIRTTRHSLANCVNCHADPKTGRVTGSKDAFCEGATAMPR